MTHSTAHSQTFKKGDRVEIASTKHASRALWGMKGTIISQPKNQHTVEFDHSIQLTDCSFKTLTLPSHQLNHI